MTKAAAASRGRVLSSAFHEPAASRLVTETGQAGMALFMTLILVMYGQSFQYVVDVMPLYALSKVWPILMAPLAILGLARLQMPGRTLFLLCFLWLFIVTPTISTLQLGNTPLAAAATTVKVWSLGYVFGLGAMLFWLRPSEKLLGNIVLGLGATTFIVMTLLFIFAPEAAFEQSAEETKIFLWDIERGRRIYAPMFFALSHGLHAEPLVLAEAAHLENPRHRRRSGDHGGGLQTARVPGRRLPRRPDRRDPVPAARQDPGDHPAVGHRHRRRLRRREPGAGDLRQGPGRLAERSPDGGLRRPDLPERRALALDHRRRLDHPQRRRDQRARADRRARVFFLHDLGWLGVTFEYGAIGVTLILLVHGVCAYITGRNLGQRSALQRACFDYVLYILITSPVYAITFAPGEVMTCTAIGFYLWHERRRASTKAAEPPKKLEAAPLQARRRPPLPSVVS
jgi:hypothetical protein